MADHAVTAHKTRTIRSEEEAVTQRGKLWENPGKPSARTWLWTVGITQILSHRLGPFVSQMAAVSPRHYSIVRRERIPNSLPSQLTHPFRRYRVARRGWMGEL